MSFRSVSGSRAALTLWLVAALLWAPIWGQWHGIAHQVQQAVSAPASVVSGKVGDLDHGHTQGSALCQVLDHLGHASGLAQSTAQALALPLLAALPVLVLAMGAGLSACWTTQARAPPHWI
jgi:hypothetical protein